MKKKNIIFLVVFIIILAVGSVLIFLKLDQNQSQNNKEYRRLRDLEVVSQHNEYVLAFDEHLSELDTFAIFKNVESDMYKKQFEIESNDYVESRFVCWTNDKLYILNFGAKSYDLATGKIIDRNTSSLFNGTTGRMDRVLGIYDGYIYYEYTYVADHLNARISLDLSTIEYIEEKDIPKELYY